MLYMAECGFTDPAQEEAWNEWYGGRRLDELLSVPGFLTSQRFKAVTPVASPYVAIHTIDGPGVFTSKAYKAMSGGGFQGWQRYIGNWKRNLFTGLGIAPGVAMEEFLAMTDGLPEETQRLGIRFTWLQNAGLDGSVPQRGIARLDAAQARALGPLSRFPLAIYAPLSPRKRSGVADAATHRVP